MCPTLAQYSIEVAAHEFTLADALAGQPIVTDPIDNLGTDQLAALLVRVPVVEAWVSALKAEVSARARRGVPIADHKLVLGKSNRVWDNPELAKQALITLGLAEDTVAPRDLVSPAKAEAFMIAHKIPVKSRVPVLQHVVKPPGAPTLVHASDPRPEYVPFSEFLEIPK